MWLLNLTCICLSSLLIGSSYVLSIIKLNSFNEKNKITYSMSNIIDPTTNSQKSIVFAGVKFSEPISSSMIAMGIVSPSPIQSESIFALTTGMSAILHAETGSGKTFSYLLPLLKRIQLSQSGFHNTNPPIQAFIIVPTKELALQVAADIISLTSSSSIVASGSVGESTDIVHLCVSTNRRGFDGVTSPIVIGTPVKIVDAMRSSSAGTFKSVNYIVLDEVDRLLAVLGKYATTEEKSKRASEASNDLNPTEMILTNFLTKVKKSDDERNKVQIIAVSATVGRPLRRELSRIVSGGATFEGFPIIRGKEDTNDKSNVQTKSSANIDTDNDAINSSVSNRKVSIPVKIKHICILIDCETEDISTKIVKVKEKWNAYCKETSPRRGILFVPSKSDVKNTVGMLNFWGLKECVDLQSVLGLETPKPVVLANGRKGRVPETSTKLSDMLLLAGKSRLGTSSSSLSSSSSPSSTENTHQSGADSNVLFVAPVTCARGLHLQDMGIVLITYCPRTMDEYLHMAGRTGRMSAAAAAAASANANASVKTKAAATADSVSSSSSNINTVISFLNYEELKRLQSWQVPLGIELKILFE